METEIFSKDEEFIQTLQIIVDNLKAAKVPGSTIELFNLAVNIHRNILLDQINLNTLEISEYFEKK